MRRLHWAGRATPSGSGDPLRGVVGQGVSAATTDSEITLYFDCNSATSGQSPQKGSGTITIGANVTAVSGQVGNANQNNSGGWGYGQILIPVSSNLSLSLGTIGFYYNVSSDSAGYLIWGSNEDTTNISLHRSSGGASVFNYKGGNVDCTISTGVHFIEIAWDAANTKASIRIDNGSWSEVTNCTGTTPTDTYIEFMGATNHTASGYTIAGYVDQIFFSSVYQKDIYAIRSSTNP